MFKMYGYKNEVMNKVFIKGYLQVNVVGLGLCDYGSM